MLSIVTDPLQSSVNKNQIMNILSNNYHAILISLFTASVVILTIYWTSKYYTQSKTQQKETQNPIQPTNPPTNHKPIPIQKQAPPQPLVSSPKTIPISHPIEGIPDEISFSSAQKNVQNVYRSIISESHTPFQAQFTPFGAMQPPLVPPQYSCDKKEPVFTVKRVKTTQTTIIVGNKEPITIKQTTEEHIDIPIKPLWSPFLQGLCYAVAEDQGLRRHMENSTSINCHSSSSNTSDKTYSFSLFDGHLGDEAAKFCTQYLHKYVAESMDKSDDEHIMASICRAFQYTDDMFKEYALKNECEAGAVGVYVYYHCNADHDGSDCIYVANVGDCRAILCSNGKVSILTEDHNPKNESEKKRCGDCINTKADLLSGEISVTRAIGDYHKVCNTQKKLNGLICDPHIIKHKLHQTDEFLIIACDGLWDVMDSKNAMLACRRSLRRDGDVDKAAKKLINLAKDMTCKHNLDAPNKTGSSPKLTADNISVMVIGFANKDDDGQLRIGPKMETLCCPRRRLRGRGFRKTTPI